MAVLKIQKQVDTYANWKDSKATLENKKAGVESDTDRAKVGNGDSQWDSLKYTYGEIDSINGKSFNEIPLTKEKQDIVGMINEVFTSLKV